MPIVQFYWRKDKQTLNIGHERKGNLTLLDLSSSKVIEEFIHRCMGLETKQSVTVLKFGDL